MTVKEEDVVIEDEGQKTEGCSSSERRRILFRSASSSHLKRERVRRKIGKED